MQTVFTCSYNCACRAWPQLVESVAVANQKCYPLRHLAYFLSFDLQNVASTALVVIDELGRGTSSEEGVGLCCAVCENMLGTKVSATQYLTSVDILVPLAYMGENMRQIS